jgi:hypothetical protein
MATIEKAAAGNFDERGEPVARRADETDRPAPIVGGYGNLSDCESFSFEQRQRIDEMFFEPLGQVR